MHPHISILKSALERSKWEDYSKHLTANDFPDELQVFWNAIDSWFKTNEGDSLSPLDVAAATFTHNPKKQEFNSGVIETIANAVVSEVSVNQLVKTIKQGKVFRELSLKAYDAAEGRADLSDVQQLIEKLDEKQEEEVEESDFVEGSLSDLLERTYEQPGLRWRLGCLNRSLGSLRKGDFGFVFARPETGKTTFLADQVAFMAEQTEGLILWFNNEEQGDKVKIRVYQGSLGVDLAQLHGNRDDCDAKYLKATGDRIKIVDRSNLTKAFIERLCKKYKPALVLIDQIDKVQGFKADREDLMLGAIYIWARELAKTYCPVIAICQAGGTGENVRYLTMNHVANAHTAKQAEADWILGIGFIHDTGWEQIRFLNISKNKLQGDVDTDPKLRHGKFEVLIQPEIARYKDLG